MSIFAIEALANKNNNLTNLYLGHCFGKLSCLTAFDNAIKFSDKQSAEAVLDYFNTTGAMAYKYQITEHEMVEGGEK